MSGAYNVISPQNMLVFDMSELCPPNTAIALLYTSGPVSLKERLLYTLDKLFVKQVKSFLLLLDLDPFILLSSPHNIKHIKFTSP